MFEEEVYNKDEVQKKDSKIISLEAIWDKKFSPVTNKEDIVDVLTKPEYFKFRDMVLHTVFEPQVYAIFADAKEKFINQDRSIGFRGILAVKNGPADFEYTKGRAIAVKDIQDIVKDGSELEKDSINVSVENSKDPIPKGHLDHYRVMQYLLGWVPDILENKDSRADDFFPTILVYDLSKMTKTRGYGYEFNDTEDKADALLAAYPIDVSPLIK